ncbi:DUF4231 domain-containing protein [[Mycoplasma] mobile]|nr:DUF4231 domain-containing protein [[Mycoplasma] mobile]
MINQSNKESKILSSKEDVRSFTKKYISKTFRIYSSFRFLYYLLNFIIIALTFNVVIISTLNIAKLAFQDPAGGPSNVFVFTNSIISSVSAFLSSIVNFFVVKDTYKKNWKIHKQLKFEKMEFELRAGKYTKNTKENEIILFETVCLILEQANRLREYEKSLEIIKINKEI